MITCETCKYFRRDTVNPVAGMGRCMHDARHGYWHPNAPHTCKDFDEKPKPEQREHE